MARIVRAVASGAAPFGGRKDAGPPRHFLDIDRYQSAELRHILDLGFAYKNGRRDRPLEGKTLAMIFEKPSTRTRVSFEVAMRQSGGDVIILNTAAGVSAVAPNKVRAARSLGAGPAQVFFYVALPATIPYILTGMRLAMANSFVVKENSCSRYCRRKS